MASSYATNKNHHHHHHQLMMNQMSVLAQAKPVIIDQLQVDSNFVSKDKDEEGEGEDINNKKQNIISTTSSSIITSNTTKQQRFHHEDDNVIHKQNAANQMRQAAVLAAVASQQKVRLSAKERLAMTAKKPANITQTQTQAQITPTLNNATKPNSAQVPTLETLLAVQRQLQQHTKQNLDSFPSNQSITTREFQLQNKQMVNNKNKPLPPFPPQINSHSPLVIEPPIVVAAPPIPNHNSNLNEESVDKDYPEKELPPLPETPSSEESSTSSSQLNSLDSQQSSPSTSLVSIPPPPPPLISSYLDQYDEVATYQSSSQSESPNLEKISSSVIKSSSSSSSSSSGSNQQVIKATNSQIKTQQHVTIEPSASLAKQNIYYPFQQQRKENFSNFQQATSDNKLDNKLNYKLQQAFRPPPPPPPPICFSQEKENLRLRSELISANLSGLNQNQSQNLNNQNTNHSINQSNIQQNTPTNIILPASLECNERSFDQPDSGNFRFPTPPPPGFLDEVDQDDEHIMNDEEESDCLKQKLFEEIKQIRQEERQEDSQEEDEDDEEDDEDFQCNIPTPPLVYKSMSSGLSTFQAPSSPVLMIKKQVNKQSNQSTTFPSTNILQHLHQKPSQLTVHITNNNSRASPSGLLSSSNSSSSSNKFHKLHHETVNHERHLMNSSSSSPSSSSDGDGHSSTASSSSTSGIHSSIDSPSSSSSKLNDFNYSSAAIAALSIGLYANKKPLVSSTITSPSFSPPSSSSPSASASSSRGLLAKNPANCILNRNSLAQDYKTNQNFENNNNLNNNLIGQASGGISYNNCNNNNNNNKLRSEIKSALKPKKKSVSFSDKVEMVACAEEQTEDHLPNPLLARVLASRMNK